MRIGFAGSPEFAASILSEIVHAGFDIERVLTQPPRPTGRGRKVQSSTVHTVADSLEIPCFTPTSLKKQEHLVSDLDLLVVAAYGLLLPEAFFDAPRWGSVNIHASLLPRWRGATPIEHAILNADATTGISLMQIEKGLDTGPIFDQSSLKIEPTDTTASLTHKLARSGGQDILKLLRKLKSGEMPKPHPQPQKGVTYAPKLSNDQARINWNQSAEFIERQVRAFVGRSAAFTNFGDVRIKILEASTLEGNFTPSKLYVSKSAVVVGCGTHGLNLKAVQLNRGKGRPLPIKAAMNGYAQVFSDATRWDLL